MSASEEASLPPKPKLDPLPSVEPPTASFILQLFLIPLLIVSIVIAVWLMFSWLAHAGKNDPQVVLRDLKRMGSNSFQRAHELATMLEEQGEQGEALRHDRVFAQEVGALLTGDLKNFPGNITEAQGKLRLYLCHALALFEVEEAIPPLVAALRHTGDGSDNDGRPAPMPHAPVPGEKPATKSSAFHAQVRMGAAESLAILASRLGSEQVRNQAEVIPALIEAASPTESQLASDELAAQELAKSDPRLKSGYRPHVELKAVAAYSLGVLGGETATNKLAALLRDAYPSTRYNAATGLARQGDERALETILEMLDPLNTAPAGTEWHATEQEQARVNVLRAGMQAALRLKEVNPQADVTQAMEAIKSLANFEFLAKLELETAVQGEKKKVPAFTNLGSQRLLHLYATETLRKLEDLQKKSP